MSIVNWIVQKCLLNEAKKTARWAKKNYDEIKSKTPGLEDQELYIRMLFDIDKD